MAREIMLVSKTDLADYKVAADALGWDSGMGIIRGGYELYRKVFYFLVRWSLLPTLIFWIINRIGPGAWKREFVPFIDRRQQIRREKDTLRAIQVRFVNFDKENIMWLFFIELIPGLIGVQLLGVAALGLWFPSAIPAFLTVCALLYLGVVLYGRLATDPDTNVKYQEFSKFLVRAVISYVILEALVLTLAWFAYVAMNYIFDVDPKAVAAGTQEYATWWHGYLIPFLSWFHQTFNLGGAYRLFHFLGVNVGPTVSTGFMFCHWLIELWFIYPIVKQGLLNGRCELDSRGLVVYHYEQKEETFNTYAQEHFHLLEDVFEQWIGFGGAKVGIRGGKFKVFRWIPGAGDLQPGRLGHALGELLNPTSPDVRKQEDEDRRAVIKQAIALAQAHDDDSNTENLEELEVNLSGEVEEHEEHDDQDDQEHNHADLIETSGETESDQEGEDLLEQFQESDAESEESGDVDHDQDDDSDIGLYEEEDDR